MSGLKRIMQTSQLIKRNSIGWWTPNLFPKHGRKPIAHLTEKEVNIIHEPDESFEGWNGSMGRLIA